jgi:hypothetical protein
MAEWVMVPAQAVIAGDNKDPVTPMSMRRPLLGRLNISAINKWIFFIHSFFLSFKKNSPPFTLKWIISTELDWLGIYTTLWHDICFDT